MFRGSLKQLASLKRLSFTVSPSDLLDDPAMSELNITNQDMLENRCGNDLAAGIVHTFLAAVGQLMEVNMLLQWPEYVGQVRGGPPARLARYDQERHTVWSWPLGLL